MKISRQLLLWCLAVGVAVGGGSAAVAAAGPRSDVLTPAQVSADLVAARASAALPHPGQSLKPDEWAGLLPSAGVTARCAGRSIELTDYSEATKAGRRLQVRPGPGETVSLSFVIGRDHIRVAATAWCVDGLPRGSYVLGDEPVQPISFGKWVDMGITGCSASSAGPQHDQSFDPNTCQRVPIMALSALPETRRTTKPTEPTKPAPTTASTKAAD